MAFDKITLSEIPGAIHFSAEELQSHLAETLELRQTRPVTIATIIDAVGYNTGKQICDALWQIAATDSIVHATYYAMTTVGVDLSRPERQSLIDAVASGAGWPPEWTEAIKGLGVVKLTRYAFFGFEGLPTIEECQEWLDRRKFEYRKARAIERWEATMQFGDDPVQVMQSCWEIELG